MSRNGEIKKIIERVRLSMVYTDWVRRNKGSMCIGCNTTEDLQYHHYTDLYHLVLGLWKFYGESEATYQHLLSWHQKDNSECDGVTLCAKCHGERHPGRSTAISVKKPVQTDIWAAIPRVLGLTLTHSTRKPGLGLIAFQTLMGLGHYILNGYVVSKATTINHRRFAQLLGKTPSSSFNKSLLSALWQLEHLGILEGSHSVKGSSTVFFEESYLLKLQVNPWFYSLKEVRTSHMCTLALRWWLGFQSNRGVYRCGLDKLKGHLGISVERRSLAVKALKKGMKGIRWATMKCNDEDVCEFRFGRRRATPIHSLREILHDSINHAL